MHHHIHAQIDRALQIRRGKRIVHHHIAILVYGMRDGRDLLDIY
jgi:hypothetical protein